MEGRAADASVTTVAELKKKQRFESSIFEKLQVYRMAPQ